MIEVMLTRFRCWLISLVTLARTEWEIEPAPLVAISSVRVDEL